MLRWFVLSMLLFHSSLTMVLQDDIDGYDLWRRGNEPSEAKSNDRLECKKDILIVWDNSNSINSVGFRDHMIPFLKKFTMSSKLGVGEDGTRLGFITFSDSSRTKTLLKIGDKKDPKQIVDWLDSLNYDNLNGQATYMGEAFKIANDEFTEISPLNHRKDIEDVVLLFTDGEPKGYRGNRAETEKQYRLAEEYSAKLRNEKNVKVVGLAITSSKFDGSFIGKLSTDGKVIKAELNKLDDVLKELVADTCSQPAKLPCVCDPDLEPFIAYARPGEDHANVFWPPQKAKTKDGESCQLDAINPQGSVPGKSYPLGEKVITYQFSNGDHNIDCVVEFNVVPCECSATQTVKAMVNAGSSKAVVTWEEPEPTCKVEPSPSNPRTPTGEFAVGEHTVTYRYTHSGATNFKMECQVNIVVEACDCPSPQNIVAERLSGRNSEVSVSWKEPHPNCKATPSPSNPSTHSGMFTAGEHTVMYRYRVQNRFDLECRVRIEVPGEFCGDIAYDPDTQVCCCGRIHSKKNADYKCCGQDYINSRKKMCCQGDRAITRPGPCPKP